MNNTIANLGVAAVFDGYPPALHRRLMQLRQLIFETAEEIDGVGKLEEELRWGQPSYITSESKSGSMIRIDRWKSSHTQYAMYFHCQTTLVDTFRTVFPNEFRYEGNRAIIFDEDDDVPVEALKTCIAWALTYHSGKRTSRGK
ncbi:DUF1801 domain-containing protein [Paenibacillus wynnii]|uniref:YdhG-like domain-containing protein n=1 Tax=Paenibacillus wynnii TaxID=268407 RepID=A0A098M463_9BACL|nr:DUF1801 domain-containing protein [Paenibacillus wynnii]KGE16813.1 hypothetical protein PWYN_19175 [Paenibacillus wynnii]